MYSKSIICFFSLFWVGLLLPFMSDGQSARLVKFTQSPTGVVAAWRQKQAGIDTGPDSWERLTTTSGLSLIQKGAAIAKPVSSAFPQQVASLDFGLYKTMTWPDGFVFTDYYRRTDVPLANQFSYRQLIEDKALTLSEQADPAIKLKTYYEVGGNTLGQYENSAALCNATVSDVLTQYAALFNTNAIGAARVSFNFEASYLPSSIPLWDNPSGSFDTKGVLQHFPDATTRQWVCESPGLLGQSKTIEWLFQNGQLTTEIAQRTSNRFVALWKWTKGKVGNSTLVALGDGSQVFWNGNVRYVDDYEALKASNPVGWTPALFTVGANFPSVTVAGVTVSGGNHKLWDLQDWVNNYHYVGEGYLQGDDWNTLAGSNQTYNWFWSKIEPGPASDDINIPASTFLNHIFATRYGRSQLPVVWQGHNRFEFGVRNRATEQTATFFNASGSGPGLGIDGPIMAPYQTEVLAIVQRMAASYPGDGLTIWTTWRKAGPGESAQANSASNRPLWERMGYYKGLARLYQFKEYFTPSYSPIVIPMDNMYLQYTNGITGGNWGQANTVTSGGNGYYKRGAGAIASHQNPSDKRSTTSVMARIVTKTAPGGQPAKWALITATNWRQSRTDNSTFNIRFKANEIGTPADCDVTGVTVVGWNATVFEVCLEPAKMTQPALSAVTSSTITSTTGTGSGTGTTGVTPPSPTNQFFGFTFTPIPSSTPPANNEIVIQGPRIKLIRRLDYGGAITHVSENGGGNYVNNYDLGRQLTNTFYTGPNPYNPNPSQYVKPAPPHPFANFGYNPIETGNWTNQPSELQAYGYESSTGTHYIKCRARNFPTTNYQTGYVFERWSRLISANVVRNWYKVTVNRNNDSEPVRNPDGSLKRFPGQNNEMPILYGNASLIWKTAYYGANGVVKTDHRGGGASGQYGGIPAGEPWIAAINDSDVGIGITGPEVFNVAGDMHGDEQDPNAPAGEFGGRALYLANSYPLNIDPVGTIYYMFDVVVGNISEIRTQSQVHTTSNFTSNAPDYSFVSKRHNFYAINGLMNDEGANGAIDIEIEKNNIEFKSPVKPFQASDVPTMYVRMKNSSSRTGFAFTWRKPGQLETDIYDPNTGQIQWYQFTVPNDGQYHTIGLPLAGQWRWTGLISQFGIRFQPANEDNVLGSGQRLYFQYIGKTP